MASPKTDIFPEHEKEPLEDVDQGFDEDSEVEDFTKSKVECICPGCGKVHVMRMRWIGRGVPRKFCQSCRERETPLDEEN
jgi:transposase-like protein